MAVASLWREPERREQLSFGAVEFHDVLKIYRSGPVETIALRGLELRIEPREFVAVFGPSGSGKSTMLHLAAGLDEPSAGDVRVFGRSLAQLDETELAALRARKAAIVFQSRNLWPGLSARENVALMLRLAGRKRLDDRAALQGILFVLHTGIAWRHLPLELGFGSGSTCYRRMVECQEAGVWEKLHARAPNQIRIGPRSWTLAARCQDSHALPSIFNRTVSCPLDSAPQLHERGSSVRLR